MQTLILYSINFGLLIRYVALPHAPALFANWTCFTCVHSLTDLVVVIIVRTKQCFLSQPPMLTGMIYPGH